MTPPRSAWSRARDLAYELASCATPDALVARAMDLLSESLASPLVSYADIDLGRRRASASLLPFLPEHPELGAGLARILGEHPAVRWHLGQPDWSPVRLADVATPRDVERAGIADALAAAGADHMMSLLVAPPGPGRMTGYIVNRADREFTEGERDLVTVLQPALAALHRRGQPRDPAAVDAVAALTRREREVLVLLAAGHTAAGIGHRLAISPRTVRKHLEHLYAKLGEHDRLAAVELARRAGLVADPEPPTPTFHASVHF